MNQPNATTFLPTVAATHSARTAERIYNYLLDKFECDDDIIDEIANIMVSDHRLPGPVNPDGTELGPVHDEQTVWLNHASIGSSSSSSSSNVASAATAPTRTASLLDRIKIYYGKCKTLEHQRYLRNIRLRWERARDSLAAPFCDPEINRVKGCLDDYVEIAQEQLKAKLANRTY
jgi:hypothetical protein